MKKKCDERILRIAILRDDGNVYDLNKLLAERPAPFSPRDPWYLLFLAAARRGEAQRQREMVEALQREVEALKAAREKVAREKAKQSPAPDLAALERENKRLAQEVRKLREQAAALQEEIHRLKQLPEKPSAPKR